MLQTLPRFTSTRSYFYIFIFLWIVLHTVLYLKSADRDLHDSQLYRRAADIFIQEGKIASSHNAFYLLPICILAGLRYMFGQVDLPFIILQSILSGLACFYLFQSVKIVSNSKRAGVIASVIFLIWWDNIHWNTMVMTDSIACSLSIFLLYRVCIFEGRVKDILLIGLFLMLCVLTRPTGVIYVAGIGFFLVSRYGSHFSHTPYMRNPLFLMVFFMIFFVGSMMLQSWSFTSQYAKGNIVTYADLVPTGTLSLKGVRIDPGRVDFLDSERGELEKIALYIYYNPVPFFVAAALKIFYLLFAVRPYYSDLHNLYSVIWSVSIYVFFYYGLRFAGLNRHVMAYGLSVIILTCLLVAISTVDWDNRFYIPMEAAVILFSASGLDVCLRRLTEANIDKNGKIS